MYCFVTLQKQKKMPEPVLRLHLSSFWKVVDVDRKRSGAQINDRVSSVEFTFLFGTRHSTLTGSQLIPHSIYGLAVTLSTSASLFFRRLDVTPPLLLRLYVCLFECNIPPEKSTSDLSLQLVLQVSIFASSFFLL